MSEHWQYVLVIPEHGNVGTGPTEDLRAVEQDQSEWLEETGREGTILRRRIGDWEDMPSPTDPGALTEDEVLAAAKAIQHEREHRWDAKAHQGDCIVDARAALTAARGARESR